MTSDTLPPGWVEKEIRELCDLKRGSSPRPIANWVTLSDGQPWVKIADLPKYSRILKDTKERILFDGVKYSTSVVPGDLILSNSATPGIPIFIGINACIHDGWILFRNFRGMDKMYFFYHLLHSRPHFLNQVAGAVFNNLNIDLVSRFKVNLPPLDEQKNIARILGNLDSKIESDGAIKSVINDLISALFRSWFIDFDPVKAKSEGMLPYGMDEETAALFPDSFEDSELGPIPTGWKVKSLLEVSNLYDNLRVPLSSMERNERKGNYPYHGATSVMDYVDDFIFDGAHLLIAEDGSVVNEDGYPVLQYVWGKFWVNNHAHVLQGKDDFTTEHLHQYVKHFYIQPFVTGAVQLKINQKALHNVKLVTAPPNINNAFNKIIQSLYRSIRENKMKNEILTLTRDALLPRLMSGELEVPIEV